MPAKQPSIGTRSPETDLFISVTPQIKSSAGDIKRVRESSKQSSTDASVTISFATQRLTGQHPQSILHHGIASTASSLLSYPVRRNQPGWHRMRKLRL